MEIVKKVVIAGWFGVGKTSLVKRFVHQKFSDQYLTTIGVKIDKKPVDVDGVTVKMMLWDIAGESSALKIPKKYFSGAHALIYVLDLTREETYTGIKEEIFQLHKDLRDIPSIVIANKADLLDDESIQDIKKKIDLDFVITSARTGVNVEESFLQLARAMI